MSYERISLGPYQLLIGLSSETKPDISSVPLGSRAYEADTDETYIATPSGWVQKQASYKKGAGERQEDSTTGADHVATAEEWEATVIDLTTNGTQTIYDGPAICAGVNIPAALSAHTVALQDDAATKVTLPASMAAGPYNFRPWKAYTSLKITPNDSSTGNITVFWRPLDTRVEDPQA